MPGLNYTPGNTRHASLTLPSALIDEIDARAKEERRSRSNMVHVLLEYGLRHHPGARFEDGDPRGAGASITHIGQPEVQAGT